MKTETVLDVVRATFEEDLGVSLVRRVEEIGLPQLDEFRVNMKEFVNRARIPRKHHNEVRPYVQLYQSGVVVGSGQAIGDLALRYTSDDLDRPELIGSTIAAFKHHLLYCHSIAVDNPLSLLLRCFEPEYARDIGEEKIARHRRRLINYLTLLSMLAPLVEQGIIVFIEPNYLYPFSGNDPYAITSDPYDRPDDFLRKYVADAGHQCPPDPPPYEVTQGIANRADFSDFPGLHVEASRNDPVPSWQDVMLGRVSPEWDLVSDAEDFITTTLVVNEFHDSQLDLYFPYRYFEDAFDALAGHVNMQAFKPKHKEDLRVLRSLISVQLPALGQLDLSDIIAIRRSEDTFDKWRSELSTGLRILAESSDPAQERSVVHDYLHTEEVRLHNKLRKSSFLGQMRSQGKNFAIGAIVAAALAPFIGPAGLGIAGGTALVTLLWNYVSGYHGRKAEEGLYHHYLLFSPDKTP